jgi:putative phosphoesterase
MHRNCSAEALCFLTRKVVTFIIVYRMRIGLLSDTHIPEVEKALPPEVMEAFRNVDLILHAGDIYISSVLDELEKIAPVLAARGDDDYGNVVSDKRVKEKHILKLEGQTLWLIHEKRDFDIFTYQLSKNYQEQDRQNPPDIVVFGHYHHTFVQHDRGVLLVNPGSPTFLNYRRGLGTVAILNIESGEADVHILQL